MTLSRSGNLFIILETDDTITITGVTTFDNNVICRDRIATNVLETTGDFDLLFSRNDNGKMVIIDTQKIMNDDVQCLASIRTNTLNTSGNNDLILRRNGVNKIDIQNVNTQINSSVSVNGASQAGYALSVVGNTYAGGNLWINNGNQINLGNNERYVLVPNNRDDIDHIIKWDTGLHRFFVGIETFPPDIVRISKIDTHFFAPIKTNTVDSVGDSNLVFQRNSDTYMTFNSTNDRVELSKSLKIPLNTANLTFESCYIREAISGVPYFDFVNGNASGFIRVLYRQY